jgi:ATP-dependent DNA helicase RecQ
VHYRSEDIRPILKKFWGHDQFRPMQEDIILSALQGVDTLALLPTGGGKSICFQVPGLLLGGTTLVVSPLVALMNDQVQNLKKRGISAVAISAAMQFKEIEIALDNAARGHVQFLYVSPERLQNEVFRQKIGHLPVTLIAVDEAHCISQWGYDFRPSYLVIKEIRQYFPGVAILALTASATAPVIEDIQIQLQFSKQRVFRQSFERRNLRYVVQKEENKIERLLKIIRNLGGTGLVYLRNRKRTEELARFLKQKGVSSEAYHAGLKYDQRQEIQQDWINNKTQVICATNAFGMGIDKPDVRFVVHLDLPESLEAYFQEAGRAGRDGKIAYSTVLFTAADVQKLEDDFVSGFPELSEIKRSYQAICNYFQIAVGAGEGTLVELDMDRICKSYNLNARSVYSSLRFLEKENYLSLLEAGIEPSKLMFLFNKEQLYEFELKQPKYEPLIKTLLRSYGGLFDSFVAITERELAYRVKNSVGNVVSYLEFLHQQGILDYRPQTELPRLLFTMSRMDARYLALSPQNYALLKERQRQRIDSVIAYTNNEHLCRQSQLLAYFDEQNFTDCGHCDVCIAKRPKNYQVIRNKMLAHFKQQSMSLEQLKELFSDTNDELWIKVVNELVEEDLLYVNGSIYAYRVRQV